MALPAQALPEEQAPQERREALPIPETRIESPVEQAAGEGREKVISIFKGRAQEEKQALERLGVLETQEAESVPEATGKIEAANQKMSQEIAAAEQTALMRVEGLLGVPPVPANDVTPETVQAQSEVAQAVEMQPIIAVGEQVSATEAKAVETRPVIAVGEVASTAETAVEKSEEVLEAEEQRDVAAEVIKENYEALSGFAKEHGLTFDVTTAQVPEVQLAKLTQSERMYVQVLMGKHAAGRSSMLHAEKLLQASEFPQGDPKRLELMREAESLAADAALKETAAQAMQQNYLNLPEIAALAGGGGTGGSVGGADFEAQRSPFGGEPEGPNIPSGGAGGLYDGGGGAPGHGVAEIKSYKTPDAKADKPKPSLVDRFVKGNVGKIKDWFGQFGPEEKGRE